MYKTIVEEARKQFLLNQNKENKQFREKNKSKPSLWPSSLLSCKRKTAHNLIGTESTLDFSYESLSYMDNGNIAEDATARALEYVYNAKQNVPLKNDIWSGKADFIINFGEKNPIIVEHKATGDNNFKKTTTLPKRPHVAQLALYGHLYEELYHVKPKLILYYWAWHSFAEFELNVERTRINAIGVINNNFVTRNLRIDIKREIEDLEKVYRDVQKGLPLPDRLTNKSAGCTYKGNPSCQYYYSCWGNK